MTNANVATARPSAEPGLLFTIPQAATMLGLGTRTVWRLIHTGALPSVRPVPRAVRVHSHDLLNFIEQSRVAP